MTAEQILGCKQPGDLFSCPEKLDEEFKALSKEWHPDKNNDPRAADIMATINQLHDLAEKQIDIGAWTASGRRVMKLDSGKSLLIEFNIEHPFELGTMFVCDASVVFIIKKEHEELAKNYKHMVTSFKFPSARIKEDMIRYLPHISTELKTDDGNFVIAVTKTDDVFLLRDVFDYYDGKIPPRHVAWIMSGLYNNCCYLRYTNVAHNGFTLDNYFISPKFHSGLMLGGWWYSIPMDKKITLLPRDVHAVMPPSMMTDKSSSALLDLECIKAIGRTLLGDKTGTSLHKDKDTPEPLIRFLNDISRDDALEEYKQWGEVLTQSFGPRKFIKMDLDKQDLYNKLKKEK